MCKDQVGGLRQETFPHWACLQDNHIARPAMKPHQSGWAVKDHLEMLGITAGLRMRVLMCFPYYFCTYSVKFGGGKHPCFSSTWHQVCINYVGNTTNPPLSLAKNQ